MQLQSSLALNAMLRQGEGTKFDSNVRGAQKELKTWSSVEKL